MAIKLTKKQAAELQKAVDDFDTARTALADMLDSIASEWEEAISEKSERWLESEAGQTAQERAEMVRGWFDELPSEGEPAIDVESLG